MKTLATLVALALALATPTLAQERPGAEDILKKVEAAVGTAENRAAVRSLVIKGTVSPKGMPTAASFEEYFLGKERAVMVSAYPGMGEMTTGTDGKITWSSDTVMGVEVKQGKEQGGARRMLLFGRRAAWRHLYESARLDGKAEVGDRPCWKLAMRGTDGVDDHWYVDRENHDLLRADVKIPDFTGGELPMQWRFSDYRDVGGIRYAHERKQIAGNYEITYKISKIEANVEIDPGRMAPPEAALEKLARGDADPTRATEPGVVKVHKFAKRATAVSKKTTCKPETISATLGQLLPKVMGALMAGGHSPAGPPFTRYHSMSEKAVVLEAGMPVSKPVEAQGDIVPGWLPAGEAAVTWHYGDYKNLGKTHAVLERWLEANGWERNGPLQEVYWTDPGLEPDQAKWRTQLICPVKKKAIKPSVEKP